MKPIEVMARTFGVPQGANLEAMMGIAVRGSQAWPAPSGVPVRRPGRRRGRAGDWVPGCPFQDEVNYVA